MPYYLLYDKRCSLCVRFQEAIKKRDRRGRIEPVGLSDPRISQIVPRMKPEELLHSFHLVFPDGRIFSGHRAMPELLNLLPGFRPVGWFLKHAPFAEKLSERVYAWIASHRE